MSVGKRLSTDEPLTEHDIAERLDKAAARVWRIMHDVRENFGDDMVQLVLNSRYNHFALYGLHGELHRWGVGVPSDVEQMADDTPPPVIVDGETRATSVGRGE